MFTHPQQNAGADSVLVLRQEAGKWLRALRETAGLSQRELAKRVGLEYYTFISQIESGRGRVPPTQIKAWAEVLGVVPRRFAIEMMRYYDPLNYELIFGAGASAAENEAPSAQDALEERIRRLEQRLDGAKG